MQHLLGGPQEPGAETVEMHNPYGDGGKAEEPLSPEVQDYGDFSPKLSAALGGGRRPLVACGLVWSPQLEITLKGPLTS